jgi:hypothetical protein
MAYNHVSYLIRASVMISIYVMEVMYASIVGGGNADVTIPLNCGSTDLGE